MGSRGQVKGMEVKLLNPRTLYLIPEKIL